MPKVTQFKANSVIYFQGDQAEKIYILKSGKVLMKYNDIDTNEEIRELIATGEFFGVKSALGKYPRDETAFVLQDAEVLVFQVSEFEQLVLSNTRIIMKMLKVFSNQLRSIVNKVQSLMGKSEQIIDQETGLYNIGNYYFNNRQFRQAIYAFTRYLTYYPSGKHAAQANIRLQECERVAVTGRSQAVESAPVLESSGGDLMGPGEMAITERMAGAGAANADVAKGYYEAVSLMNQEKYPEAYRIFSKIVASGADPEHTAKAEFEMGRCLVSLSKFDDGIRHFTALIQKYPKHPDLKEALFFIGKSYEGKKDVAWAKNFYGKIISMAGEDEPVAIKARKSLKALEGVKA